MNLKTQQKSSKAGAESPFRQHSSSVDIAIAIDIENYSVLGSIRGYHWLLKVNFPSQKLRRAFEHHHVMVG